MKYFVFRAKEPDQLLPFYPRSTGKDIFKAGDSENLIPLEFVEICWVASGICKFKLGDGMYTLQQGDSLCRMPGEHRYKCADVSGTTVYWATFDGAGAETFIRSWGFPRPPLHSGSCPFYLFDAIGRGLLSTAQEDARKLISVYSELIACMFGSSQTVSESGSLMRECLYRINSKLSDPDFNINTLADELGIHRVTIGRLFKKNLGLSPLDYLTSCRVRLGLELLSRTILPVSEIAGKVGLSNSNYFCRLIKRHTNMTPGEYRKGSNLSP